ncbi:unnamed protein product [Staurois parvus]|uniref:Uncharacterized protein n=1 Tax=Staurois parvus TaxID=386267 RepID=A0ABN9B0X0_9NEOB|nr:unnamed protein product [Staurois parvus]
MSVPKSGNPELHSGLPCGAAQGVPAALTLSFASAMCPLQRPRPSPSADAGIRHRDVRAPPAVGNLKI